MYTYLPSGKDHLPTNKRWASIFTYKMDSVHNKYNTMDTTSVYKYNWYIYISHEDIDILQEKYIISRK